MTPLQMLRHHVTGAIERGEAVPIVEIPGAICKHCKQVFAKEFNGQTACLRCIETVQNHREE